MDKDDNQIAKNSNTGIFILALGAFFGFLFPAAAKWILLVFVLLGISDLINK